MIATAVVLLLVFLLVIRTPVGFAMAISGGLGLLWFGGERALLGILSTMPRDKASVYEFLTIPMFLLMAEFVLRSGVADDLFRAAAAWFGRLRGGLGIATAFAGAGFGAICGSSTAAAATLSSTSLKAMLTYGYEPRMASGAVAISGTLAMLIPPSIAMVVYGLLADVGIAKLLVAGIIPGILVTLTIALTVYVLAWRDPSCAPLTEPLTIAQKLATLRPVAPMLVLLFSVTGIIYTGLATPTEASAAGALCSAVIYFTRGRRTLAEVYDLVSRAVRTSAMIAMILLGATIFATFFALTQTTQGIVAWVNSLDLAPLLFIAILLVALIILGCFLDQLAIMVLTIPIVVPLVDSMGFDLIWFGVIFIVTAELGMVTPPLGLNAFVVAKYSKIPLRDVFIGILPHFFSHVLLIAILVLFPAITLWLPAQM
jgi:C4-dicarboxylate transporter, DctM subunit